MAKRLFDIQLNGFGGLDFQQPGVSATDRRRAVDSLAAREALRFFATLITDGDAARCAKFGNLERHRAARSRVAIDMGPPDIGAFDRPQAAASGNVRLLTLAPGNPPASIR